MKIHIPGIGTQYVDEAPPAPAPIKIEGGITIEEAIRKAQERAGLVPVEPVKTEVLKFTREVGTEAPLLDNSQGVSNPDNVSGQLEHGKVEVPAGAEVSTPPVLASAPASEPANVEQNTVTFTLDPNATDESEAQKLVDRLSEFGVTTPSDDLLK